MEVRIYDAIFPSLGYLRPPSENASETLRVALRHADKMIGWRACNCMSLGRIAEKCPLRELPRELVRLLSAVHHPQTNAIIGGLDPDAASPDAVVRLWKGLAQAIITLEKLRETHGDDLLNWPKDELVACKPAIESAASEPDRLQLVHRNEPSGPDRTVSLQKIMLSLVREFVADDRHLVSTLADITLRQNLPVSDDTIRVLLKEANSAHPSTSREK